MDADSVSHMMHSENLITTSEYKAITAAPNDININRLLLQYVRAFHLSNLLKFCDLLENFETQQCIGESLEKCMSVYGINVYLYLCSTSDLQPSVAISNQLPG